MADANYGRVGSIFKFSEAEKIYDKIKDMITSDILSGIFDQYQSVNKRLLNERLKMIRYGMRYYPMYNDTWKNIGRLARKIYNYPSLIDERGRERSGDMKLGYFRANYPPEPEWIQEPEEQQPPPPPPEQRLVIQPNPKGDFPVVLGVREDIAEERRRQAEGRGKQKKYMVGASRASQIMRAILAKAKAGKLIKNKGEDKGDKWWDDKKPQKVSRYVIKNMMSNTSKREFKTKIKSRLIELIMSLYPNVANSNWKNIFMFMMRQFRLYGIELRRKNIIKYIERQDLIIKNMKEIIKNPEGKYAQRVLKYHKNMEELIEYAHRRLESAEEEKKEDTKYKEKLEEEIEKTEKMKYDDLRESFDDYKRREYKSKSEYVEDWDSKWLVVKGKVDKVEKELKKEVEKLDKKPEEKEGKLPEKEVEKIAVDMSEKIMRDILFKSPSERTPEEKEKAKKLLKENKTLYNKIAKQKQRVKEKKEKQEAGIEVKRGRPKKAQVINV
jgi:hypothetical protein